MRILWRVQTRKVTIVREVGMSLKCCFLVANLHSIMHAERDVSQRDYTVCNDILCKPRIDALMPKKQGHLSVLCSYESLTTSFATHLGVVAQALGVHGYTDELCGLQNAKSAPRSAADMGIMQCNKSKHLALSSSNIHKPRQLRQPPPPYRASPHS